MPIEYGGTGNASGQAASVANKLSLSVNGSTSTYDGSSAVSKTFYAPTSKGTSNQVLRSTGGSAPTWVTLSSTPVSGNNIPISSSGVYNTLYNDNYILDISTAKKMTNMTEKNLYISDASYYLNTSSSTPTLVFTLIASSDDGDELTSYEDMLLYSGFCFERISFSEQLDAFKTQYEDYADCEVYIYLNIDTDYTFALYFDESNTGTSDNVT